MCFFLTTYLPSNSDVESVRKIADHHGIDWEPIKNKFIRKQLDEGVSQYLTTKGHCQCYLAPSANWDRTLDKDLNLDKEIKSFRRKGWSESKIKRWVHEKVRTRERKLESMKTSGLDGEVWLSFLEEVVESKATHSLGILFHFYGDLEGEEIHLVEQTTHSLKEITGCFLHNMQVDHLYWFTK